MSAKEAIALRRARLAIVIVSVAIAMGAAFASVYQLTFLPLRLEQRQIASGAAAAQIAVGSPLLRQGKGPAPPAGSAETDALITRTSLVANLLASPEVVDRIGRLTGLDPARLAATARITQSVPRSLIEPDFERRADQILDLEADYRLDIQARPAVPIIDIYSQAPSADEARLVADAMAIAGNAYLRELALRTGADPAQRITLEQLGAARGSELDSKAPVKIAGLTFLFVFAASLGLLALAFRIRLRWLSRGRSANPRPLEPEPSTVDVGIRRGGDDWPRTARILPWMIAVFIGVIWLVPFNAIQIDAALPVDLKLDRLLLPAIVATFLMAMAIGGATGPRFRFTPIHAGIAVFATAAGLSVVLNAGDLTGSLGLDLALKKLTLLAAFIAIFVVIASTIRRSEVRAFLGLTLGLAVLCALGTIWEYRYGFNVFYDVSAKVLPSFFDVLDPPAGFDELGRRSVSGPTDHGLEVVAILSMALPIALVRLIDARRLRNRILYGLAACVLAAAAVSTYRKSAFIAPFTVGLTVACFRPREVFKLVPLGLAVLIVLPIFSFSAFGSVAGQFDSERLDVPTVGDRVADYDAVRPELLSSPAFGRGFGSYEHAVEPASARILDSDLLLRVVEMGLVGLAAFVLMIVMVIVVAAPVIRARDPVRSPPALVAAAAAAAFLVLAALFDEWSFPHAPYVFLSLLGLLAVVLRPEAERPPGPREGIAAGSEHAVDASEFRTGPTRRQSEGKGTRVSSAHEVGATRA